jgi:hypothetical protein
MAQQPAKMSDMLKEMSEFLFRQPQNTPSSEAVHVALFFANVAWNECVGLNLPREGNRHVWETIEQDKPDLWNEFKSDNIDAMIDELVQFKQVHYAEDRRRILTCGMADGKIRVEWLAAATPGVDSKWEMRLYGLVRTGNRNKAVQFLQETRNLKRKEAAKQVEEIAAKLGVN